MTRSMRRRECGRRARGGISRVVIGTLVVAPFGPAVVVPQLGGRRAYAGRRWVATWAASPIESGPSLVDTTERMVVRATVGGSRVRVRLSNALNAAPITLGAVWVARSSGAASVVARSRRQLTVNRRSTITLPPGAEVWSDPVPLTLSDGDSVAISLYAADAPTVTQLDDSTGVVSYRAQGEDTADTSGAPFTRSASTWLVADGVAVERQAGPGTVVALGDSITAGFQFGPTPNVSWPALLAPRLLAASPSCQMAVVNAGISGNRLTESGGTFGTSPSALRRMRRDVLDQPGVRVVVVLIGINDIASGVPPAKIIAGYRTLIRMAHAAHLRIVAGTLLPAGDAARPSVFGRSYSGAASIRKRHAVTAWIRTSGAFDGVIDFTDALANPRDANQLAPAYDSGDHLHPSDAGYARMAATVDPALLRRCPA